MNQSLHTEVTRKIAASKECVFRAWTTPEDLIQWIAPSTWPAEADVDLHPGGAYRLQMRLPNGTFLKVSGTYHEIVAPQRLVFTWQWEGDERQSLVTVQFGACDGGTEVRVRHEHADHAVEEVENHRLGWSSWLDRLAATAPTM